jgi:hypothetical protein
VAVNGPKVGIRGDDLANGAPRDCRRLANEKAEPESLVARRSRRIGSDTLAGEHSAQAFLELNLALPAEQLGGARNVRLPNLWVVQRQRLEDDPAPRAGNADDRLCRFEADFAWVPEVDGQVLVALGEKDERPDEIVDVAARARLRAVVEDGQRNALERLRTNVGIARPSWGRMRGPYVLKMRAIHVSTPCWRW